MFYSYAIKGYFAFARKLIDDTLLCLIAAEDEEDEEFVEDLETFLAFSLIKEPFTFTFKIDLEQLDRETCVDLFRYCVFSCYKVIM